MSNQHASGDARAKAEAVVKSSAEDITGVSTVDREMIVDALAHDLAEAATESEDRLVKLESQTRVLAEAVIAITDQADVIAPAVEAVKAKM